MSLRSSVFGKLLLSGFFLIAATLLALDFYLTRLSAGRQREAAERQLAAQARILAGELAAVQPAGLGAWARDAGDRAQARITLIDPGGVVLADSQHDPHDMENHSERPEVREALHGRLGVSIRSSATLRRDLCYLAVPVPYQGRPGFALRLAVPLGDLDAAVAEVRWRILAASLAAAALALVLAYLFSRRFSRRVQRLESFARSMLDSRFSQRLAPDACDELGSLAASLDGMAAQLRELMERSELELSRREAILGSMVEGVLAVDADLRVTFCNASFARAVGAQFPVGEGLPLRELAAEPQVPDLLDRILLSGTAQAERLQLTGGRSFQVQAAPLVAGSRRGAIAILHDITELERLERVRRDFVANVSHELKTPLAAIGGCAETLLDGALEDPGPNRKFVEIIRAHAVRLNNIASDLLVLSELESGVSVAPPEPISIRAALESAIRTVESEARIRNVKLRWGDLEDHEVMGYRVRLEQALVNLLDNAVKFNRPGGDVSMETSRTLDGQVRITIADTGIGIPAEHLPRIFERFYRVDKARSREVGGTGLGLSIVKHVVERMGGAVTAESEPGQGSRFTVLLPTA